jgi:integrase
LQCSGAVWRQRGTETGVDAETASQQLGHSSPAITREFYISKPTIAADAAHVLDELAVPDPAVGPNTWGTTGNSPFGFK